MSMDQIRQGLETMLDSINGVNSASGWPVEQINAVPACFVGFDDDAITMANLELDLHLLPVTFLVQQKGGNLKNQVKAVEAVIDGFRAAVRANQDLGLPLLVAGVRYTRIREGVYQMGNTPYVGFVADVTIKTTQAVSFA
jgi:hypothetical protein